MKILFISNHGGGFADHIDVADGCTVKQLFEQRIAGKAPWNSRWGVGTLRAIACEPQSLPPALRDVRGRPDDSDVPDLRPTVRELPRYPQRRTSNANSLWWPVRPG